MTSLEEATNIFDSNLHGTERVFETLYTMLDKKCTLWKYATIDKKYTMLIKEHWKAEHQIMCMYRTKDAVR